MSPDTTNHAERRGDRALHPALVSDMSRVAQGMHSTVSMLTTVARRRSGPQSIMRMSGPVAVDNLGFQTVWRIAISERPSAEWVRCFGWQQDGTVLCKPTLVSFHSTGILFTSDSARLATWVKYIDKWTRATNLAVAAAHERHRQEALSQTPAPSES